MRNIEWEMVCVRVVEEWRRGEERMERWKVIVTREGGRCECFA